MLKELFFHTGRAAVLGITGAPGAGKSTLVDQLVHEFRREDKAVGVLAVDPTSPYTGGAVLGDRIRMLSHHADPGVFIRSMATRGHLGGLAAATTDMALLLDAAGKEVIVIETVGVGQDEVEIAKLADVYRGGAGARHGRRCASHQSRHHGDRRHFRHQQMRSAGCGSAGARDPGSAKPVDQKRRMGSAHHAHGGDGRPGRQRNALRNTIVSGRPDARSRAVANWALRLREMLRERLIEQFANIDFRAAAEEVAARRRDPYTITDGWINHAGSSTFEIDHLGIAVRSLDAALGFYEKQLGFAVSLRETVQQEKVNVAMLPAGDSRIELLEASEPDSVIAKFIEKRGEGLHHVAVRVPDLAATVERLKAHGARLLNEPRAGAGGHIYVFVHPSSTGGVLLELIQRNQKR